MNEQQAAVLRRWKENPFAAYVHIPPIEVGQGTAKLELTIEAIHLRPGGLLHGGMVATLLDTITGYAASTAVSETSDVLTMQLNVNMISTAKLGERLTVTANTIHAGRRTAVVAGEIRRADGKLVATATATMFIVAEGIAK